MEFFGYDIRFWLVVIGATIVKVISSPFHSIRRAAIMIFVAFFCAVVFTEPVVDFFGLNRQTYGYGVAAALALTGEGFIRMILQMVEKPEKLSAAISEWFKWWTGRGSK